MVSKKALFTLEAPTTKSPKEASAVAEIESGPGVLNPGFNQVGERYLATVNLAELVALYISPPAVVSPGIHFTVELAVVNASPPAGVRFQ